MEPLDYNIIFTSLNYQQISYLAIPSLSFNLRLRLHSQRLVHTYFFVRMPLILLRRSIIEIPTHLLATRSNRPDFDSPRPLKSPEYGFPVPVPPHPVTLIVAVTLWRAHLLRSLIPS